MFSKKSILTIVLLAQENMKFQIAFWSIILTMFSVQANAAPFVCLIDTHNSTRAALEQRHFVSNLIYDSSLDASLMAASLTCQEMKNIGSGLQAISFTMTGGAIAAACTGVGAPVTVLLQSAALGFSIANLVVGQLPCRDPNSPEEIKKQTRAVVCEELNKNGITCRL